MARISETLALCPHCAVRISIDADGKIPWHKRRTADERLEECPGIGMVVAEAKAEAGRN